MAEGDNEHTTHAHDEQHHNDAPFCFVGEALAFDFINTEMVVRGKPVDALSTTSAVTQWWYAAARHYPDMAMIEESTSICEVDDTVSTALHTLRGALRGLFGALVDGMALGANDLALINNALALGRYALTLDSGESAQVVYRTQHGGADALCFAIAHSAIWLVRNADRSRIHRCGNPRCVLFFYDTTKSATRRWCSVGCMDRARSAKRYQAQKERSSTH
jgi:predicted RNA-binding Zn ribbon-like protein